MFRIIENRYKFISASLAVILLGVIMFFVNGGFVQDVEFAGGMAMYVDMGKEVDLSEITKFVEESTEVDTNPVVQRSEGNQVIIKTTPLESAAVDNLQKALLEKYELENSAILQVENITASLGNELKAQALKSTLIAALLMLVYIAFRFTFKTGVAAVVALIHNVLIMMTVYIVFKLPINSSFIAAILTIIGYSINDTIVVFDRIRENRKKNKRAPFDDVANASIKQTLDRTINTSVTTLITIVMLYILGVSTIKMFAFPLIVGIVTGTYSSIFIASPLWAMFEHLADNRKQKRKLKKA